MMSWILSGCIGLAHGHGGVAVLDLSPAGDEVAVQWQVGSAADRRLPAPPEGCEQAGEWTQVEATLRTRWTCAPSGATIRLHGEGEGPVRVVWRGPERTLRALSLGDQATIPSLRRVRDPMLSPRWVSLALLLGLAALSTRVHEWTLWASVQLSGLVVAWVTWSLWLS